MVKEVKQRIIELYCAIWLACPFILEWHSCVPSSSSPCGRTSAQITHNSGHSDNPDVTLCRSAESPSSDDGLSYGNDSEISWQLFKHIVNTVASMWVRETLGNWQSWAFLFPASAGLLYAQSLWYLLKRAECHEMKTEEINLIKCWRTLGHSRLLQPGPNLIETSSDIVWCLQNCIAHSYLSWSIRYAPPARMVSSTNLVFRSSFLLDDFVNWSGRRPKCLC